MALIERRIGLLFAAFLVLLLLAAGRALCLGTVKGSSLRQRRRQPAGQLDWSCPPGAARSSIATASSSRSPSPPTTSPPRRTWSRTRCQTAAQARAAARRRRQDTLLRKLAQRDSGFAYLARRVPASQAHGGAEARSSPASQFTAGAPARVPAPVPGRQLLGSVGTDGDGLSGLEYADDKRAARAPTASAAWSRTRSASRSRSATPSPPRPGARPGADDRRRPSRTRSSACSPTSAQTYRPHGATAIVMDPRTGEVLALANWPRINANDPGGAPSYATQDRAVGYTYEPGSTFKAFTVAGALQDGTVTPSTPFDLPPQIQVADRTIGESHRRGPETLTTAQILAQSSQRRRDQDRPGDGQAALRLLGAQVRLRQAARASTCPARSAASCCPLDKYSGSSMGNLPIGQGLPVTPMQMAQAYSAIANGGDPALAARRAPRRRQARCPQPKGKRIISTHDRRRSCARCSRACSRPGGTRQRGLDPGLQAGGQDRHGEQDRPGHGRVLEVPLHRLVHGLRAGRCTRSC